MKQLATYIFILISISVFSQNEEREKKQLETIKKTNSYVYEGNEYTGNNQFVSAEMAYRKAISNQPTSVAGTYNLGTSYYNQGNYTESLYRLQQAANNATSKEEKHKAFHNIGNILMMENKCQEAVEAFKNALRNNPSDNESRYNFALAKKCAEDQKDEQQDDNKDEQNKDQEQDENKENEDKENKENEDEGDQEEDQEDKGDQDKKDGEDEKDEDGKPKDDKQDQGKGENKDQDKEQQKPQPQPGQLSPQQVKNLLEAMNNQEQKVQEKMNAEKQKGAKIQTEKDW